MILIPPHHVLVHADADAVVMCQQHGESGGAKETDHDALQEGVIRLPAAAGIYSTQHGLRLPRAEKVVS